MMSEFIQNVCNQMLKGINRQLLPENRTKFYNNFESLVTDVTSVLPGSFDGTYSAVLGAVACKCAIKYGTDKAKQFLLAMKDCKFTGQNDPAHLLWLLLNQLKGPSSPTFYNKAVCAARAHCEGRTITELRIVKQDIFEWNEDFTGPKLTTRAMRAMKKGLPKINTPLSCVDATCDAVLDHTQQLVRKLYILKNREYNARIMAEFLTSKEPEVGAQEKAIAAARHWLGQENQCSSDNDTNSSVKEMPNQSL